MKVLFLDIDGVVNCKTTTQRHRGYIGIDPYMAFLVGRIVEATDAKVVLSSSWRYFEDGRAEVERQVVKCIDVTPNLPISGGVEACERGNEIQAWLTEHPEVERYAILDDDSDFLPDQPLFKTSWETGLTEEIAGRVIQFLNVK